MPFLVQTYVKAKQFILGNSSRQYTYMLLITVVSVVLSSKGITDEGIISLNGDMPRYMMNGVYFHDLVRDLPFNNFVQYTMHYFAKYPALSLGHHPLFPGVALAPFYAIFGVSVFSARLMVVVLFVLMGIVWFLLIKSIYDEKVALISTLLLVTNLPMVQLSRIVMSEIAAMALMIIAFYFFYRFCKTERNKYGWAFVFSSVLSVYAKHTAIILFPFCFGYFAIVKGFRSLIQKRIIFFSTIIVLLVLPLVPITLKFSQYNVELSKKMGNVIVKHGTKHFFGVLKYIWHSLLSVLQHTWNNHFILPVLIISLVSACISLLKRRRRETAFLSWIVLIILFFVYIKAPTPRHTIYWIPAFCLLAATSVNFLNYRLWNIFTSGILLLIVGYQFVVAYQSDPEYAYGYEEAAKYVVNNWKGDSVLYCSDVDTGYFILFIRKHDQGQYKVALRADKILATSSMNRIIEDRIKSRGEIYEILDRFGIAYIVMETVKFRSPALKWLQEEVVTDRFIQRKMIPIHSEDPRLTGTSLLVYEYRKYGRAKADATLEMKIPLMGDSINVKFNDLLQGNGQ